MACVLALPRDSLSMCPEQNRSASLISSWPGWFRLRKVRYGSCVTCTLGLPSLFGQTDRWNKVARSGLVWVKTMPSICGTPANPLGGDHPQVPKSQGRAHPPPRGSQAVHRPHSEDRHRRPRCAPPSPGPSEERIEASPEPSPQPESPLSMLVPELPNGPVPKPQSPPPPLQLPLYMG